MGFSITCKLGVAMIAEEDSGMKEEKRPI